MRNAELQHRARSLRNQSTDAERHLWQHLRDKQLGGYRFRRQVPVAGFIADFACLEAKLIVELDGGQHARNAGYDEQRDRLIEAQGFRVLRFWDNQVFQETQAVLQESMRALDAISPHPDPPPQAEEGNGRADTAALQVFPCPPQAEEGMEKIGPVPLQVIPCPQQAREGMERKDLHPQAELGNKSPPPLAGEG